MCTLDLISLPPEGEETTSALIAEVVPHAAQAWLTPLHCPSLAVVTEGSLYKGWLSEEYIVTENLFASL